MLRYAQPTEESYGYREAIRVTAENIQYCADWCDGIRKDSHISMNVTGCVKKARVGDWVIKGADRRFYPSHHSVFIVMFQMESSTKAHNENPSY